MNESYFQYIALGCFVILILANYINQPKIKSITNSERKSPKNVPESQYSDLIPWTLLVHPSVILNKNGSYLSVLEFRGKDVDSLEHEIEINLRRKIHNALLRLDGNWAFSVDVHHFEMKEEPATVIHNAPAASLISAIRRTLFSPKAQNSFETKSYLSLTFVPPTDRELKTQSRVLSKGQHKIDRSEDIRGFVSDIKDLVTSLGAAFDFIKILEKGELKSYLHKTVTADPKEVSHSETTVEFLDYSLTDSDLSPGITPKLGDKYIKVIDIKSFPDETFLSLLNAITFLDIPFRWNSRFIRLNREDSKALAKNAKKLWFNNRGSSAEQLSQNIKDDAMNADNESIELAQNAKEVEDLVASGNILLGYYVGNIILMHKEEDVLFSWIEKIKKVFNAYEMLMRVETLNSVEAFVGAIPSNFAYNPRKYPVSTLSFIDLAGMTGVWCGNEVNRVLDKELPCLALTSSEGALPFRLNNFYEDIGHTLIIGPNGSGKSTLLSSMENFFLKYENSLVISFDKEYSAIQSTYANNGAHYDISLDGTGLSFQPLRNLDNNADAAFCIDWIGSLLEDANMDVTPIIYDNISEAIYAMRKSPKELRTLSHFTILCQNEDIKIAMKPFCDVNGNKGQYASVLDSNNEVIDTDVRWITFETSHLMQHKRLVAPVFRYLFHKLTSLFDGRPVMMPIDEGWKFLKDKGFVNHFEEWLRELRKKFVSVLLATQEPEGLVKHPLFSVIVTQMTTKIFLANNEAETPEQKKLYKDFGLNDRQISIIADAIPKRDYYLVQPNGARKFDLALDPVQLALVSGASTENTELCKRLIENYPKDEFAEQYLIAKGFSDYGEMLKTERLEKAA